MLLFNSALIFAIRNFNWIRIHSASEIKTLMNPLQFYTHLKYNATTFDIPCDVLNYFTLEYKEFIKIPLHHKIFYR